MGGGGGGRVRADSEAEFEFQSNHHQGDFEEVYGLLKSPIALFSKVALTNVQPIYCIFL